MGKLRNAGKARSNPYADVQIELTVMIFDRVLPTVLMGGTCMVALTVAIAIYYRDPWLWWLAAVMTALWVGRIVIVLRFSATPVGTLTARMAESWERLYGYYSVLYMISLGASTLRSMHAPDSIHFTYCAFGSFLLCNAISARLGMRPRLVLLQCGVMLVALTIAILHQPSIMVRCNAVLVLGYLFSLWEATKIKFDITVDQLRSRRKQRHLAEHDALTELANRRHFEERLSSLCEENASFAVFFLDLDGFKKVNDVHGHAIGDALLQHVAERLQGTVRASDLVARFGGDEFAILQTPHATHQTAAGLAARLIDCVSAPYKIKQCDLRIGTSIGIQLSLPEANNPDALLSQADQALYAVKHTGKGRFAFAEPAGESGEVSGSEGMEMLTAR